MWFRNQPDESDPQKPNEIIIPGEKSSVDLKLKLCRGTSARKIIVREAKSFCASKVLVGISKSHHTIRSSASVAKYIAKKLSNDCWVIAVNNGKIMFQREGSPLATINQSQGKEDVRRVTLLNVLQRSVSLNQTTKVVNHSEEDSKEDGKDQSGGQSLEQTLAAARFENCAVCSSDSLSSNDQTTPQKLSEAFDFDKSEDDSE